MYALKVASTGYTNLTPHKCTHTHTHTRAPHHPEANFMNRVEQSIVYGSMRMHKHHTHTSSKSITYILLLSTQHNTHTHQPEVSHVYLVIVNATQHNTHTPAQSQSYKSCYVRPFPCGPRESFLALCPGR